MWRGRPCPRRRRRRCTARLSSPSPVPRWCLRPTSSECRLRRAQDDDRVVDLLEGTESLCRNAEDSGQHPRWKPADGLTYADVVFVLRRTGVLDDRYVHVCRATVLEVVKGTLGREHDLADMLIEALVVTVPVDDDPGRDSAGDDVQLPRAGCQCGSRIPPGCNVSSRMLASWPLRIGKLSSLACLNEPPSSVVGG